jgi:bifunctional DNA-binding transcriptional regulator/antitoxin component of YhaV-PrlF toxin-antitoxin module
MVNVYQYGKTLQIWQKLNQVEIKEIDEQGRIVIPKDWRRGRLKTKKVLMKLRGDSSIEIVPYTALDLTKYFDIAVVDVKSPLTDWHSLSKELHVKKKSLDHQ